MQKSEYGMQNAECGIKKSVSSAIRFQNPLYKELYDHSR